MADFRSKSAILQRGKFIRVTAVNRTTQKQLTGLPNALTVAPRPPSNQINVLSSGQFSGDVSGGPSWWKVSKALKIPLGVQDPGPDIGHCRRRWIGQRSMNLWDRSLNRSLTSRALSRQSICLAPRQRYRFSAELDSICLAVEPRRHFRGSRISSSRTTYSPTGRSSKNAV